MGGGITTRYHNIYIKYPCPTYIPKDTQLMTLSAEDIQFHAQNIRRFIRSTEVSENQYCIELPKTPDDPHTTLLFQSYIPNVIATNTLSDIHDILRTIHPNTTYTIKIDLPCEKIEKIITLRSTHDQPNIIAIEQYAPQLLSQPLGCYILNISNIPAISCEHLSIYHAINQMRTNINQYVENLPKTPGTTHKSSNITHVFHPLAHHPEIECTINITGNMLNQHINITINMQYKDLYIHSECFTLPPNSFDNIDALYQETINKHLQHIHDYPAPYCTHGESQHYYISLLRDMKKYINQPDPSILHHIKRCLQNLHTHYVYITLFSPPTP